LLLKTFLGAKVGFDATRNFERSGRGVVKVLRRGEGVGYGERCCSCNQFVVNTEETVLTPLVVEERILSRAVGYEES